eukprot:TRINITY_DN6841_c0_g1_i1.p1 TRINITY_DN6841_c0_g1~~TRINITY_DN6841_c0_g1_i1.p1  ORF type:complete len:55 (-),score=3.09 TRINITY_DN6841_c0_g1_i1:139-303(-)
MESSKVSHSSCPWSYKHAHKPQNTKFELFLDPLVIGSIFKSTLFIHKFFKKAFF